MALFTFKKFEPEFDIYQNNIIDKLYSDLVYENKQYHKVCEQNSILRCKLDSLLDQQNKHVELFHKMETLINNQSDIINSQNIGINSLTSELTKLRIELESKTTLVENQSNLLAKYQRHLELKKA